MLGGRDQDDVDASVWCLAEDATQMGDLGTPGQPNGTCPQVVDTDYRSVN